ncbi:MAG: DedA family protein [Planctomycetes bacterium]|nr:DedA family protein [Planctomycetota bacterium]
MNETAHSPAPPRNAVLHAMLWPLRALKRLYHWVVGWADTRFGTPALFVLSFVEASFFPIPPDPLLIALCLGKRRRALWFGAVCTVASVLGGILGWYIGLALFDAARSVIESAGLAASWFGTAQSAAGLDAQQLAALPQAGGVTFYPDGLFYTVKQKFDSNAFLAYFSAALTPIPFKVFTIAGGLFEVSLTLLIAGSIAGRGARFFALSALIFAFGDKVKPLIEKHFEWLTVALVLVGVAGFAAVKYLL